MSLSILGDGRAAAPTPREEGNDASQEGRQSSLIQMHLVGKQLFLEGPSRTSEERMVQ